MVAPGSTCLTSWAEARSPAGYWMTVRATVGLDQSTPDWCTAKPSLTAGQPAKVKERRAQVSLDVYNGTTITGLSGITGRQLAAIGFTVHQSGLDWSSPTVARTIIQYPAGDRAAAKLVRQALPGATMQRVKGLPRIRIVLGASGYTVAGAAPSPSPARSSGPPSPAVQNAQPGQQRTAAQDACH